MYTAIFRLVENESVLGSQQQRGGTSLNKDRGLITSLSADELITAVKSVPLKAAEAQTIIDVLLHRIISKVDTKEAIWKRRLAEREAELDRVRDEKDKLAKNNAAMEESLNVVNSAEEV